MHELIIEELQQDEIKLETDIKVLRQYFKDKKKGRSDKNNPTHIQLMQRKDKANQLKLNKHQLKTVLARQVGFNLLNALPDSKNSYKYWAITQCCYGIHFKEDQTSTSKYCGQRFCPICASIRTAKMIHGYLPPFAATKKQLYFLTLTAQTIPKDLLPARLIEMQDHFSRITKNNTEQKRKHKKNPNKQPPVELNGLRKLELIVAKGNKYHAHFHIIMDSKEGAQHLIDNWVKKFNKTKNQASHKAQKIVPVTDLELGLVELCKYVSKPISKKTGKNRQGELVTVTPEHMDWILTCLYKKITFKPFGKIKRHKYDYTKDRKTQTYKPIRLDENEYLWNIKNWYGMKTKQALGLARPNLSEEETKMFEDQTQKTKKKLSKIQSKMNKNGKR